MPMLTNHFDGSSKIGNLQSKPVFSHIWLICRSHNCQSTSKKMQDFCMSWNRRAELRNLVFKVR